MASESSSAVLELNDADTEDTDTTTMTDDPHEGAPVIMEHGFDIAVKVDAPMKQLSTLETFVTYRVRCVCGRWPTPPHVRRRYNHFKLLHKRLAQAHPLIAPPPLPPLHSARQQLDRYSPSFVAVRTMALNAFLDRVAKHPILTHSTDFRVFLTTPDEELDKVFKSENSALNLWGLSSALYGSGETKNPNGPRVKDPEFTSAADYLTSLQHKLTTLCALTTKLHKGTAALSTEMMGMKRACDAWATQARGRGARGAAGVAAGAGGAASALAGSLRTRTHHKALLPLLAAYAAAHVDKIKQRDSIHAAYVSGNNTTDDLHNRLEQASEALRSELSDWTPKTRADVKTLLLDLADRQVTLHTQTLQGWEYALNLSTEANIGELFKTVSKTAVQNLSPSKCRSVATPTETERDLDDISEDFDLNSGIDDFLESKLNGGNVTEGKTDLDAGSIDSIGSRDIKIGNTESDDDGKNVGNIENVDSIDVFDTKTIVNTVENDLSNTKISDIVINDNPKDSDTVEKVNFQTDNSNHIKSDSDSSNPKNMHSTEENFDSAQNITKTSKNNGTNAEEIGKDEFLNEILSDTDAVNTSVVKNDVISDPLRSFTDVDLS